MASESDFGSPRSSNATVSALRRRASWLLISLIGCGLLLPLPASTAWGQIKYNPDDEYVENLVKKGIAYLESNAQRDHGEATLAALAVVEASKRYQREVPGNHPLVQHALGKILEDVAKAEKGTSSDIDAGGIYYCCLSIILLLELDDELYRPQINTLVTELFKKRVSTGAFSYTRESNSDSSQTQYAALAFTVLKLHGYQVYVNESKGVLEFFCNYQSQAGSWYYHTTPSGIPAGPENKHTLSLHMAGAGTVYLLQDLLNLTPRRRRGAKGEMQDLQGNLPPSVAIYVEPKEGQEQDPDAPLTSFDASRLSATKRQANTWFGNNFSVSTETWNYYYLYGLERYAYFRSKAEGSISEVPNWYDQGVEFLASMQGPAGGWETERGGLETNNNSTCFAILFLVRASEILMLDANSGQVAGNKGFQENVRIRNEGGQVTTEGAVRGMEDVMTALKNAKSEDDIEILGPTIAKAVTDFSAKGDKSRAEQKAFLQGLVTDEEWFRRKVAVKFLAASQDLENVPALLYALSDPVKDIRIEAHNGLRLISRKIDAFPISSDPSMAECLALKEKWTEWFRGIRPDVKLFDD